MKRIDAEIGFREYGHTTTVWVDDNATNDDIENAIIEDMISELEISWVECEGSASKRKKL